MFIGYLITQLVLIFLPNYLRKHRTQIVLLLNELLNDTSKWTYFKKIFTCCKKKEVIIQSKLEQDEINPIFNKMQIYIGTKFIKKLQNYELMPKSGDIEFSLSDTLDQCFIDEYANHTIQIKIEERNNNKNINKTIILKSKTASPDIIKAYVKNCINSSNKDKNKINIYRPLIKGKKKGEQRVEWEHIKVRTNKTLSNTIYSETIEKELFGDIDHFINSLDWYDKKGLCYKRGYFLYGPPGTGKTSVAKILANMYEMPVFCLDLITIDDNSTLIKLMTELNYHVENKKYILLIEDADRCTFFKSRIYYEDGPRSKVTMDCFLNIIDGIVEPHGRITIITANDPTDILSHQALMRPNRIDKSIEITYCDTRQIKRIYELFYPDDNSLPWEKQNINRTITPAYMMKLLQEGTINKEVLAYLMFDTDENKEKTSIIVDENIKKSAEKIRDMILTDVKHGNNFDPDNKYPKRGVRSKLLNSERTIKKHIKLTEKNIKHFDIRKTRVEKKLSLLNDKLKKIEEKNAKKKSKEQQIKDKKLLKQRILKRSKLLNKSEEEIMEEINTPEFLLNKIEANVVDDIVYTISDITHRLDNNGPSCNSGKQDDGDERDNVSGVDERDDGNEQDNSGVDERDDGGEQSNVSDDEQNNEDEQDNISDVDDINRLDEQPVVKKSRKLRNRIVIKYSKKSSR